MHLKVSTLADITSSDGKRMLHDAMKAEPFESCSSQRYTWPNTAEQPQNNKKMWEKALRLSFSKARGGHIDVHMVRNTWNNEARDLITWWFSPTEDRIYEKSGNEWIIWSISLNAKRRTTKNGRLYQKSSSQQSKPDDCIPANITKVGNKIRKTSSGKIKDTKQIHERPQSTREKQLEDWKQCGWPIRSIDIKEDGGAEFAFSIQANNGRIVCDGSFKDGKSSSAFLSMTKNVVRGTNIVPGRAQDQSAYRGEMGGILGSIIMAKKLCKKYKVPKGTLTIGCDCEGAIKACESYKKPTCRWTSYDIACRIKYEIGEWHGFKCYFKHVDGHQDDIKKYEDLDEWEKANVEADSLAKKALLKYTTQGCPTIDTPITQGDKWAMMIDGEQITSRIKKTIYNRKWKEQGKKYWTEKMGIHPIYKHKVDWEVIKRTSKMCTGQKRKIRSKHMANIGPVGSVLHRRGERESALCPRCQRTETNIHVTQCKGTEQDKIFQKSMEMVDEWLATGPIQMSVAIKELLNASREQRDPVWTIIDDMEIRAIAQEQWFLSNITIMWGFFHKSWNDIVQKHLLGTRRSSHKWLAILSNRIWEITEDAWKHRNSIEHGDDENNERSKEINQELDKEVDSIYDSVPPMRQLPVTSRHFFGKGRTWRKNRKIKDKRKWIRDASVVLRAHEEIGMTSPEAIRFREYFGTIRNQEEIRDEVPD